MEQQLSLHLKNFNNKVKVMNQTNSKELVLTALEARNIQAELFEVLAHIADLTEVKRNALAENAVIKIDVNGGSF
jgi:ribosomal protein S8E